MGGMPDWVDESREALARSYERAQGQLYLLRFALLFALAAAFWMSGLSRALAAGLESRFTFPHAWPLVCVLFTALAVFSYEVILFPLSVLAEYSMERAYGRLEMEFGSWLRGFSVTMLLEMSIISAGFTGIYILMHFLPRMWWLAAAGGYALGIVGLGEWGASWLLPRIRPPVPAADPDLEEALHRLGREAGIEITGAAWWDFDHQEELEAVRLVGWGRQRRAVFSRDAWRRLDRQEQLFLAARHMAWLRNGAARKLQAFQVLLAAVVFGGAGWLADAVARSKGLSGLAALEAFPFWVAALFAFAALAGLVSHALFRKMELQADRFALRHAGGREALEACLRQEFEQQPFAMDLPRWQVLFSRIPTPAVRLARAQALTARE